LAYYLVHCHVPGITLEQLAAIQRSVQQTSERISAGGQPVRLIRSTFVPSESHVMYLFEAPRAKLVRDVNELAQMPFSRIVEALDLGAASA